MCGVISIRRQWVHVPLGVLAGFESWPVGSSPNLSCVVSEVIQCNQLATMLITPGECCHIGDLVFVSAVGRLGIEQ